MLRPFALAPGKLAALIAASALLLACEPKPPPSRGLGAATPIVTGMAASADAGLAAPSSPATLDATCCTMACFPGGMLGVTCTEEALRAALREKARAAGAGDVANVTCAETNDACNQRCESQPGVLLRCTGTPAR